MEKVSYGGWPNCVRLSNAQVELIATTDVGPRIIRFGFIRGQNMLKEFPESLGQTGGDEWQSYGGHRLWHAPESQPRTYWPDNVPVESVDSEGTLKLVQPVEGSTGIQKQMEITLALDANRVRILHRLTNRNLWTVELAPWALTVMAPGGRAIIPQEPYRSHTECLLPARPLVLWYYTDMRDPRWIWGTRYIQLRQHPHAETKQKIGVLNRLGWMAYTLNDALFIKRYAHEEGANYPDFGCNTECYTDPDILELETLGPLTHLEPGASVEHVEEWLLCRATVDEDEESIDTVLLPLLGG